jgi:mono/diheme cytochrome c family protein
MRFLKAYILCLICCALVSVACSSNSPDDLIPITEDMDALVTYENTAKAILDQACVECHGGSTPTAGIRLDNFADARAVAQSERMIFRMTNASTPMPPSGRLPDPIVEAIMKWIDDGLLEN